MIKKLIALFKKKPEPKKPMATRNEKGEAAQFDAFIKDFSAEDYEDLMECIDDEN